MPPSSTRTDRINDPNKGSDTVWCRPRADPRAVLACAYRIQSPEQFPFPGNCTLSPSLPFYQCNIRLFRPIYNRQWGPATCCRRTHRWGNGTRLIEARLHHSQDDGSRFTVHGSWFRVAETEKRREQAAKMAALQWRGGATGRGGVPDGFGIPPSGRTRPYQRRRSAPCQSAERQAGETPTPLRRPEGRRTANEIRGYKRRPGWPPYNRKGWRARRVEWEFEASPPHHGLHGAQPSIVIDNEAKVCEKFH